MLKLEFEYEGATPSTNVADRNNGSMRKQTITVPTVGSNTGFTAIQTYNYDELNRLSSATETVSGSQTWKEEFSYDRFGNRNYVTGTGHTTTLGSCSTAVCNPTISTSTNRLISTGYSYDYTGNLTADATGQRFSYDPENHQTAFFNASNSGSTPDTTYAYDGDGKRVKKTSGSDTTIFVYDAAGQLAAEYSTTLSTTQQVSYLTQDHLGSPRIVTNENGAVTDRKDFTSFGSEATSSQRISSLGYTSVEEPRSDYTGYQRETESGLQFAQARYYNPQHGRYLSTDSASASASVKDPQTMNRYSYVVNQPFAFVDPLGLTLMDAGIFLTSDPVLPGIMDRLWIYNFRKAEDTIRSKAAKGASGMTSNGKDAGPTAQPAAPPPRPFKGPAQAVGGQLQFGGHTFEGDTTPTGGVDIDIDLGVLTKDEQDKLLNHGAPFTVNVSLGLSSDKDVPIETRFIDSPETTPGKAPSAGTSSPDREITPRRQYVTGTSRVTTADSNASNVAARDDGRVTFSETSGGRTVASFSGAFNYQPDTARRSSFVLAVFTKREDYALRERSGITIRINLKGRTSQ